MRPTHKLAIQAMAQMAHHLPALVTALTIQMVHRLPASATAHTIQTVHHLPASVIAATIQMGHLQPVSAMVFITLTVVRANYWAIQPTVIK